MNLARQAAEAGVKRFVFVSTVKVNGEATMTGRPFRADDVPAPQDSFSMSKHEAEVGLSEVGLRQIAEASPMEVVIVRPPLVHGPMAKGNFSYLKRVLALGLPLPFGALNNSRSMVALDNLVDLLATCLRHPAAVGQTFLVSDSQDVPTTELLLRIANAMRKHTFLFPVPVCMLKLVAALIGKSAVAQLMCGSLQVEISKTCALLDWAPVVTLDEGLRRAVQENF